MIRKKMIQHQHFCFDGKPSSTSVFFKDLRPFFANVRALGPLGNTRVVAEDYQGDFFLVVLAGRGSYTTYRQYPKKRKNLGDVWADQVALDYVTCPENQSPLNMWWYFLDFSEEDQRMLLQSFYWYANQDDGDLYEWKTNKNFRFTELGFPDKWGEKDVIFYPDEMRGWLAGSNLSNFSDKSLMDVLYNWRKIPWHILLRFIKQIVAAQKKEMEAMSWPPKGRRRIGSAVADRTTR